MEQSNTTHSLRKDKIASFEAMIHSSIPELQDVFHRAIKELSQELKHEHKERIGTLALEEHFLEEKSSGLKSLYAGTPYKINKHKLLGLSNTLSEKIVGFMRLHLTKKNIEILSKNSFFHEELARFKDKNPGEEIQEHTFHTVLLALSKKYFKNRITKNLSQNLPHLAETLDFNMFFNTEKILTPKMLEHDVVEIQEKLIAGFLDTATNHRPQSIQPLSEEIIEKIKNKKLITSSGLNFAIQGQKNLIPMDRKYYMDLLARYANEALLHLIKGEHAFHSVKNSQEKLTDDLLLADLRNAKKEAEKMLRGVGEKLRDLAHRYTPEIGTAHLTTDFDSSLESLNLFELISLLMHSKTLNDHQAHEIQQLAFFSHLSYAIVSDPHYKEMKQDDTFHINRVAPESKKFYVKKHADQSYYISDDSGGQVYNNLIERTWTPESTTEETKPIKFFYIGNREKSILSIMMKFFVRDKVQHIEDFYDLWGASFVLNCTKEDLKDEVYSRSLELFLESIGKDNLYTELYTKKNAQGKPLDPPKGFFTIEKEKANNENTSVLYNPIGKLTAKTEAGVGKEIIIYDKEGYLSSLDQNSPANHSFYEDFRFLKFALQITPAILYPERHRQITQIYKKMEHIKHEAEKKHIS